MDRAPILLHCRLFLDDVNKTAEKGRSRISPPFQQVNIQTSIVIMVSKSGEDGVGAIISKYRPDLESYEEMYKNLHAHGELSMQERNTAKMVAEHLQKLSSDFDIRTNIGGTGLIAILDNQTKGKGKTILLRAEMDALPVKERTEFSYASSKEMKDTDGQTKPVMHACGHDIHVRPSHFSIWKCEIC